MTKFDPTTKQAGEAKYDRLIIKNELSDLLLRMENGGAFV